MVGQHALEVVKSTQTASIPKSKQNNKERHTIVLCFSLSFSFAFSKCVSENMNLCDVYCASSAETTLFQVCVSRLLLLNMNVFLCSRTTIGYHERCRKCDAVHLKLMICLRPLFALSFNDELG